MLKPSSSWLIALAAATGLAATATSSYAQAPGVPIEQMRSINDKSLLEQAKTLREAGKLLKDDAIAEQLKKPVPASVSLPKPRARHLRGSEVADLARQGNVHVGWYYLCKRCSNWHMQLNGAYAIAKNAIATCHHCVLPANNMKEGYFILVDPAGTVFPVNAIIAKSQTLDAAILLVDGGKFTPLPLNDKVGLGDAAYCLSDPLGQNGYFSAGIVNRFYWRPGRSGAPGSLDELKSLRMNVSTDWAPGSSGAAVLDDCGNVIGHVSTISPLSEGIAAPPSTPKKPAEPIEKTDDHSEEPAPKTPSPTPTPVPRDRFNGATLITLHDAVPARGVIALVNSLKSAPASAPRKNSP